MVNQKRIALFVDIDNMPLNKKHVDNIITQLEKSGEIVYAKIYGVTDRRHREIICDAVARGFETVPPVYPTRRGSTKVFDIRILVDLCELFATNKSIDGVAIVANPAHQVYLFSRLKRNGIKIFACDNLDEDSAKFVDEVLSFGYNDPNSVSKGKKIKLNEDVVVEKPAPQEQVEQQEQQEKEPIVETVENTDEPIEQPVESVEVEKTDTIEEQPEYVDEQLQDEIVADAEQVEEQPITEVIDEIVKAVEQEVAAVQQPVDEIAEAVVVEQEVAQEQPQVLAQEPEQEEVVVEEIEPVEEDDNLDILRQIQQIKQEVPSSDDDEDEALIEKIKQLLDEFN